MSKKKKSDPLEDLRQTGLDGREAALKERKIVQARRKEIEERRKIINANTDAGAKELLTLQEEVVGLQSIIVQLALDNAADMNTLVDLKKNANGVWHHLESFAEGSQLKQENLQGFAESVQKLREQVQEQDETWKETQRKRKTSSAK